MINILTIQNEDLKIQSYLVSVLKKPYQVDFNLVAINKMYKHYYFVYPNIQYCCRVQKQKLVQMTPDITRALFTDADEKAREENTKDILKKIEQINLNHGLTPRNIPGRKTNDEKSKQMNYHPHMFSNPVWNYLQREPNSGTKTKIEEGDKHETEEVPKGHYIKRKITHKQTYLIPNNIQMPNFDPSFMGGMLDPVEMNKSSENATENQEMTLAKQQFLINNIKNIVSSSQLPPPFSNTYNPYLSPYQQYMPYQNAPYYQNSLRTPSFNPNNMHVPFSDAYFANLQTLKQYDNSRNIQPYDETKDYGSQEITSQTIKFPNSQNHFRPSMRFPGSRQDGKTHIITANDKSEPEYIRLPNIPKPEQPKQLSSYQLLPNPEISRQFLPTSNYYPMNPPHFNGVYSSITSMVEYGQKEENCEKGKEGDSIIAVRSGKGVSFDEFDLELLKFLEDVMKSVEEENEENEGAEDKKDEDEISTDEPTESENDTEPTVRVGRQISLGAEKGKRLLKLLEHIQEEESKNGPKGIIKYLERVINETSDPSAIEFEGIQIVDEDEKKSKQMSKFVLPGKEKTGQDDKFFDKATGTGIFINRMIVRKGGVAIAGPGGIATAGSGGTAIVGPNGVAYTQPNGVAIAGPGSKVIALDPSIDLNKFVQNLTKSDGGATSRIGKVVAIGPVVYYHRDDKV